MSFFKKIVQFLIFSAIFSTALATPAAALSIVNTKHNLASWGPGDYTAASESRVCIFCHTPHNANPDGPLWSHDLTADGTTFKKYSSGTLQILDIGAAEYSTSEITGTTKLCLGCHDGLTALGAITKYENPIVMDAGYETLPGYNVGGVVDISNKHPVSFKYDSIVVGAFTGDKENKYSLPSDDSNGTSVNVAVDKMLEVSGGRVECTICHDPHVNRASDNYTSLLPFWISSSHDATGENLGIVLDSYEGVCVSCHTKAFGEYTGFSEYSSFPN